MQNDPTTPTPPEPDIEDDGFETVHPPLKSEADADRQAVYAVFDTESNGLFRFKDDDGKSVPADAPGQPRLASICIILADEMGNPISKSTHYVRPDGWSMLDQGTEASEVNGLTDEFLAENGAPVSEILDMWNALVDEGMVFAAFNAQHDMKMMRAELRRAGRDDRFEETANTCLMRAMKAYKDDGMPVKGAGFVKLRVACEFFDLGDFDWHQAEADTEAALLILQRLIADGNLIEPKVHYAKNR